MAFTIPNEGDALDGNQAELDKVDLDILVAAWNGSGVWSGCAVTATGTPDTNVQLASGIVIIGTQKFSVAAQTIAIAANASGNIRFDLIAIDNTGTGSRVGGTASSNPVFPQIPANSVIVAAVYAPNGWSTIQNTNIIDKRCLINTRTPVQRYLMRQTLR